MAFALRPDGLIDVDTELGPLPMAPEVATQLGYVPPAMAPPPVPTLGQAGATAQLNPSDAQLFDLPGNVPEPTQGTGGQPIQRVLSDAEAAARMDPANPINQPQAAPMDMAPAVPQAPQESNYDRVMREGPMSSSASTSSTSGPAPITGPERANIDAAQKNTLEAARKRAQAEGAEADALTAQAQLEANQARELIAADAARQTEMNRRLGDMKAKRDAAVRAVPDTIDPNRWDRSGGVARVMAAVSVMMGSIAQGLGAQNNPGKVIIDDMINRDIEAQREEIRQAENFAERADNEYQQYLDMYGDPILAEKQLQLNGYEAAKKEIQARIQGSMGDQVRAVGEQGIAELEAAQAIARNEMDGRAGQIVRQTTTQSESPESFRRALDTAAARDAATADPLAGLTDEAAKAVREAQVIMPDGSIKYAKDKDSATKVSTMIDAHDNANAILNELEKIARTPGSSVNAKLKARAEQLEGELTKVVGSMLAPGEALSDGERQYYASIAVDAAAGSDMFGSVKERIDGARAMFKRRLDGTFSRGVYNDWQRTQPYNATPAQVFGGEEF
jgi:hypothetical protein